ncbi:MAG: hypothetical protein HY741_29050 [Chloroflexi bacterium]|nr:hypothetical protein [Chloroflexota bacterium]
MERRRGEPEHTDAVYRQWDGQAWADMRLMSTDVTAYSELWAAVVVDVNNVAHVAWQGKTKGMGMRMRRRW